MKKRVLTSFDFAKLDYRFSLLKCIVIIIYVYYYINNDEKIGEKLKLIIFCGVSISLT